MAEQVEKENILKLPAIFALLIALLGLALTDGETDSADSINAIIHSPLCIILVLISSAWCAYRRRQTDSSGRTDGVNLSVDILGIAFIESMIVMVLTVMIGALR